jgi:hypothetical protein
MPLDTDTIMKKTLRDGIPGMFAMAAQVTSLMWLRTILNFQYARGGTMTDAAKILYAQGGVRRFYQGYLPALVQGPLSRFGDTAGNAFALAALDHTDLPITIKTACASITAGCFRILLLPVDTMKTTLQVNGPQGWKLLKDKVRLYGPGAFFHGALASSLATFVGHYPWFLTFNTLNSYLPTPSDTAQKLVRNAGIGFTASMISDSCSNSVRVIKTVRQTSTTQMSYRAAIQLVLAKDGVLGLLGRGLKTKILTNGIQGLMFSVLWGVGKDKMKEWEEQKETEKQL